ncbi:MAG: HVO_0476 family zinc finger protein [Halobacteriota archaeon]
MVNRETDFECPSCSSDKKVPHDVLRTGKKLVIRCTVCHTTQQVDLPRRVASLKLKVVVSDYDHSHVSWLELVARERLHIGDEFIVENSSVDAVRITAIELNDGVRTEGAEAESIRVLWAQNIDKVVVRIAVHSGKTTKSHKVAFDGEKTFVVGDKERLGEVARIKIKQGPVLDRVGQSASAKDIARVYIKGITRRSTDRNQFSLTRYKPTPRR